MAYSPNAQANGSKEPSGAKKSPVGFLSLVKNISRWLNKTKKQIVTLQTKRDIRKLEHERSKERGELLGQRRYYENLLRRETNPSPDRTIEVSSKKLATPTDEIEFKPVEAKPVFKMTEPEELPVPEMPKPVLEETLVAAPINQRPSSQDIFLSNKPIPERRPLEDFMVKPAPKPAPVVVPEPTKAAVAEVVAPVEKKVIVPNIFLKRLKSFFSVGPLAKKLAQEREEEAAVKNKTEVEARSWQAYDGVKANLIKDQVVFFFNWRQKMLTLSLSLILCCLAISLAYVGLLIWQKEKLNGNKTTLANFDAINAEVVKNEDELKEITSFNKKLNIVNYILNNHVYWTNFLSFLENNTLKDIYYTKFTGDLTGKFKIPSIARNLDAISLQLEVMKAYNMVKSIQYSSAQSDTSKTGSAPVNFNLEMSLDPKIFIK